MSQQRKEQQNKTRETGADTNGDGNFGGNQNRTMEGDKVVLMDVKGPGVIWRTWSATPGKGHVRIYLDGATEPVVDQPRQVTVISRKTPIVLAAVTALLALLFAVRAREGEVSFRFSETSDRIRVPSLTMPAMPLAWGCLVLLVVLVGAAAAYVLARRRAPLWLSMAYAVVGLVAFLAWSGAGSAQDFPVVSLIGGSVLVETVFTWPGTGYLLNKAILSRDLPLLQGTILILAVAFVLINLTIDLLQSLIDPRIKRN